MILVYATHGRLRRNALAAKIIGICFHLKFSDESHSFSELMLRRDKVGKIPIVLFDKPDLATFMRGIWCF